MIAAKKNLYDISNSISTRQTTPAVYTIEREIIMIVAMFIPQKIFSISAIRPLSFASKHAYFSQIYFSYVPQSVQIKASFY